MIITDTGFWLALIDRRDTFHRQARTVFAHLEEPLITTAAVVTETTHLVLAHLGIVPAIRFIDSLRDGICDLFELRDEHFVKVSELMRKYRNLPMDFADASLVILAEHLGHGRIFSTDRRDFKTYRWKERKPFENLLFKDLPEL